MLGLLMCLCNFHYPLSGIKVKIVMFHLSLHHLNHPILPYSKYSENNVRVRSCLYSGCGSVPFFKMRVTVLLMVK